MGRGSGMEVNREVLERYPPKRRTTAFAVGKRGGEGGIRTPDTVARMPHFECGAIDHSATSPSGPRRAKDPRDPLSSEGPGVAQVPAPARSADRFLQADQGLDLPGVKRRGEEFIGDGVRHRGVEAGNPVRIRVVLRDEVVAG